MTTMLAALGGLSQRVADSARARGRYGPLPPGPPEPAIAQTIEWMTRPVQFLARARQRYGDTFTMRLLGMPVVSISDPELVREVFTGSPDRLHAGEANVLLAPILGPRSVLLLDGARHMSERRLLLPPFHGQRMHAYGAIMRDAALRSIERWPRGRPFPVHARTQAITLEVVLRAVFGMSEGGSLGELGAALARLLDRLANPVWLLPIAQADLGPLSPGRSLARRLAHVDALVFSLIRERRAHERDEREDVLSMLLDARHEDGSPMTDEELRDELLTLLVAGHETTATSLAWALHRLIEHPSALARATEEIDRVFADRRVDPDRVSELPYLDAVVKETLRLDPVVPLVGRRLTGPMRIGHLDLPAGVIVAPNIYLSQRNPRSWRDPERFDPPRFLGAKVSPYAFFPFGGGVRRCIGMAFALYEMQVVLATVLSRLSIRRAPGADVRLVRRAITFAPSGGMPIVVEDR